MTTNQATPPTLAQLIKDNGLTQRKLAVALDVPESQINRWVNGTEPMRLWRREIAKHFGLKEEGISWK